MIFWVVLVDISRKFRKIPIFGRKILLHTPQSFEIQTNFDTWLHINYIILKFWAILHKKKSIPLRLIFTKDWTGNICYVGPLDRGYMIRVNIGQRLYDRCMVPHFSKRHITFSQGVKIPISEKRVFFDVL